MPSRISMSCSTSTVSNGAPSCSKISTVAAEKPHCGKLRLPFMNSTILLPLIVDWILSVTSTIAQLPPVPGLCWSQRFERQRMHASTHRIAERIVDRLMALDESLAFETFAHYHRFEVIPATGIVAHLDLRTRNALEI